MVDHQYTRHIFGARDLPTCANFALQKTATDNMSTYPEAASVVNEKFYMDDYLDLLENVTHATKISRDLVSLLKLGGFNLTKIVSNADEITLAMNPEDCETSSSLIGACRGSQGSLSISFVVVRSTSITCTSLSFSHMVEPARCLLELACSPPLLLLVLG